MIAQLPPPYYMQKGRTAQADPATYDDLIARLGPNQQFLAQGATIQYALMGTPVALPDGTVISPALYHSRDPFSGQFLLGVGSFGQSVNKTEVWRWDSTKIQYAAAYRLFMGTATDVYGTDTDLIAVLATTTRADISIKSTLASGNATFNAINNEGNNVEYGIVGTTFAPPDALPIAAGDGYIGYSRYGGLTGTARAFWVYNKYNAALKFATNLILRGQFLATGEFVVNATAITALAEKLRIGGSGVFDAALKVGTVLGVGVDPGTEAISATGSAASTDVRVKSTNTVAFLSVFNASDAAILAINRRPSDGTFSDAAKCAATINLYGTTTNGGIAFNTTTSIATLPTVAASINGTGKMGIGTADQTANARLEILEATVGNEVLRLGSVATNDDPTDSVFHGRVATTDATVTTINTVAIPASKTVTIEAKIRARRTGGAAGTAEDGAGYHIEATYKNVAGTATLIGAITTIHTAEDQAAWDATFTLSGGNVLLRVTGAVNNNITWHSTLTVSSVGT